jgi:ankyrin repeat protein
MNKILLVLLIGINFCIAQEKDVFSIARSGTLAEMKDLCHKNPEILNATNQNGFTPLILACYKGSIEVVDFLIKNTATVNIGNAMGTPLMAATVRGNAPIVMLLLENKANPNLTDEKGTTALMYAVQFQNSAIVDLLLKFKANKLIINKEGKTAFEFAVFSKKEEIINLLK